MTEKIFHAVVVIKKKKYKYHSLLGINYYNIIEIHNLWYLRFFIINIVIVVVVMYNIIYFIILTFKSVLLSTVTLIVSITGGRSAKDLSSFSVTGEASLLFFLFFRYLIFYSQTINSPKKCRRTVKKLPKWKKKCIKKWYELSIYF